MESMKVIYRRRTGVLLLTAWAVCLAGCGQPRLSKKAGASLSSTCIKSDVKTSGFSYFGGKAKTATVAGTLLGGVIVGAVVGSAAAANTPEGDEILRCMREHNIDVGQMMLSAFREQVQALPGFPPIVAENGDAEFCFEVACGLESPLLSGKLKPRLTVSVQLNGRDGKKLWKNTGDVYQARGELKGYKHKEYMEDPERLREVFGQACEVVAKQFAKNLR